MKLCVAVPIALLLAACSTSPARYGKENASQDEFEESVYRCLQNENSSGSSAIRNAYGKVSLATTGTVNCDGFNSCMASKGFKKSVNGEFLVRNYEEYDCKQ
jgi:hypothetical protein